MKNKFLISFLIFISPILLFGEESTKVFPTAVYGTHKKEKIPVFGVEGRYALSKYKGKTVKLLPKHLSIERSDYYNPGFIEITNAKFVSTYDGVYSLDSTITISGSKSSLVGSYSAKMKANGNLDNVYLVAICIPSSAMQLDELTAERINITFKKLGSLKDRDDIDLTIDVNFMPDFFEAGDDYILIPIFYSNGYEIRSSLSSEIYSYFRKQEEIYHKQLVSEYLKNNAENTLKQTPFVRFLPYLPPEPYERQGPIDTAAILTIDKTGKVRKVELVLEDMDAEAATCISDGLKDWLFLPPLKQGAPHPFRIQVPLQY